MADCARDCLESGEADFGPWETPAELAAWAAGLALVTAPVAPDLTPTAQLRAATANPNPISSDPK